MHTVFVLLCFVVVMHWLIFPYPSGLLHWHCGNLTIAPVPAKQPWWIWINTSCAFIMNDCITTTKQSTTKPCAYFLGYTVYVVLRIMGKYGKYDDKTGHGFRLFDYPLFTMTKMIPYLCLFQLKRTFLYCHLAGMGWVLKVISVLLNRNILTTSLAFIWEFRKCFTFHALFAILMQPVPIIHRENMMIELYVFPFDCLMIRIHHLFNFLAISSSRFWIALI